MKSLLSLLVICSFGVYALAQVNVSQNEFNRGVTQNGFATPSTAQYNGFLSSLADAGINNKREAAMFLAQMIHESGGLLLRRENGCSGSNGCPTRYPESGEWLNECKGSQRPQGVSYYGRGYIQLTWCSNYIQASRALGRGEALKTNPDQVASDDFLSWGVSAWFWRGQVKPVLGNTDQFGLTTKAINGQSQECQGNGQNADKSRQRFRYYTVTFREFGILGTPNEAGCPY